MTQAEVLSAINQFIVANSNNEITANILRPILVDMVNQPNSLIGDLSTLQTSQKATLVAAINSLASANSNTGITILTGTKDPNVTPPPSYELGDFYKYMVDGALEAFFQFNGFSWIPILNPPLNFKKGIIEVSTDYLVKIDDYTIVYGGAATGIINMPAAIDSRERVIRIVNRSLNAITTTATFETSDPAINTNSIAAGETVLLQSTGNFWLKIN